MLFPSKMVEIAGSQMNVVDVGSGPVVLLGHGWLCNAEMWDDQIKALSLHYRVIGPDMWGHGRSAMMPASTRTMRDLAQQHLVLLDRLGVEKAKVVGLSLGGMWGAEMALLAPDRVTSLVLMATSLAAELTESREAYLAGVEDMAGSRSISNALAEALVSLLYSADFTRADPGLVSEHLGRLLAWQPASLVDSVAPIGRIIFNRRDALPDLERITVPMLTIVGGDDRALPKERVEDMAQRLGSPLLEVPGAGHMLTYEAPAIITETLLNFLDS
jgi:pimeloyl-ACP methyl ester carboxylesterase